MSDLEKLFNNNSEWAKGIKEKDPRFFQKLAEQQTPEYLWIGCSDSRVPANEIVGMLPGDVFVHRNVANLVVHTDLNCLSVVQYAIDILKVKHVIVCGHYGCGGVTAAVEGSRNGLVDNWLQHVKDTYYRNLEKFEHCQDDEEKVDILCEINVVEQVLNLCYSTVVQDAWKRGQEFSIHGLIYSIRDGILRDLGVTYDSVESVPQSMRDQVIEGSIR